MKIWSRKWEGWWSLMNQTPRNLLSWRKSLPTRGSYWYLDLFCPLASLELNAYLCQPGPTAKTLLINTCVESKNVGNLGSSTIVLSILEWYPFLFRIDLFQLQTNSIQFSFVSSKHRQLLCLFPLQNYFARNFYNMRMLALFVAFAINFILLFYKVRFYRDCCHSVHSVEEKFKWIFFSLY